MVVIFGLGLNVVELLVVGAEVVLAVLVVVVVAEAVVVCTEVLWERILRVVYLLVWACILGWW